MDNNLQEMIDDAKKVYEGHSTHVENKDKWKKFYQNPKNIPYEASEASWMKNKPSWSKIYKDVDVGDNDTVMFYVGDGKYPAKFLTFEIKNKIDNNLQEKLEEDSNIFSKVTTTKKPLKSKSGFEIKAGERVIVNSFVNKEGKKIDSYLEVLKKENKDEGRIIIRTISANNYLNGFIKAPSIKQLEKMNNDGIAKTITGKKTEPDGYGDDGSPSWMLVIGVI